MIIKNCLINTIQNILGVTSVTPLIVASPAGRLAHFAQIWEKITRDQWILTTVKGYRIEFHTTPYQAYEPHPPRFNQEQQLLVEQEVNKLQDKGVVTLYNESVTSGEIHIHPISGTKKGRWSETSHQSEMPECIRGVPTLQDGRHTDLQEPCETKGLVSEGGPKGRLFFHPDPSRSQEIPMFPTGGENLPVHLPPVRPDLSTLGLYQDPQTDSSSRTRVGISSCNLHRRYPADGGVEGDGTRTGLSPSFSSPVPGVHHKLREDHIATNSNTRVPGFRREHFVDGVKPPNRETKKDSGGVSEALGGGANIRPCPLLTNWQDECCPLSHSTSTSVLQISTDGSDGGFEEGGSKLRYSPLFVGEQQGRASLVGHTDGTLEWKNHPDTGSGVDHRVRRLDSGLGSDVSGVRHGRTLVGTREDMAHKLSGASGSYTSAENVCKKQNESVSSAQAGQLFGSGLYKQSGRNNLKETCLLDLRSMDVVPGKEYTHPSSTPARHTELYSRQGIQVNEGPFRLEIGLSNLCQDQQTLWTTGSGLVCIQANLPVPSLLQLAARSIRRGHRCLSSGLVNSEGVCQPPLEPYSSSTESGTNPGGRLNSSNPPVEGSTMVCPTSVNVSGLAMLSSSTGAADTSGKNVIKPTSGRMEHIWESLKNQGLSEQATSLIVKSWRTKTNKYYDSLFERWDRWCSQRGSNPFSGPVSEVANFLASLFAEGYQYSSINAYRSAISSVHDRVDGMNVGQHPTIVRLVKGIFNVRPPIPRYSATWDVQKVLSFLEAGGKPDSVSLKALTLRTVFLMAITHPSRSADLSQLSIDRMRTHSNGVAFTPAVLAKQSRQGKPIEEFFFPSFPGNTNLFRWTP